jgi:hypothetical protein
MGSTGKDLRQVLTEVDLQTMHRHYQRVYGQGMVAEEWELHGTTPGSKLHYNPLSVKFFTYKEINETCFHCTL